MVVVRRSVAAALNICCALLITCISTGSHAEGALEKANQAVVDHLLADPNMQCVAGFQSSTFLSLQLLADMLINMTITGCFAFFAPKQYKHMTDTVRPVINGAGIWCAIFTFGKFDPTLGGHRILFDLGLIIEFLPGSIRSASLRHGNTPVQPSETRYSVTQFCAGGLMCWVCYRFKGDKKLSKKEKASIDTEAGLWSEQVLSRFSKVGKLCDNLCAVFNI
jgi:hypothetical protein